LAVFCSLIVGCGRAAVEPPVTPVTPEALPPAARSSFAMGLAKMAQHEKAGDWSETACNETLALLKAGGDVPVAAYDTGLVLERCKQGAEARRRFEAAIARDPSFYPARAALARYIAAEPGGLDKAIAELHRAVLDSRFASADAQVALATLQMKRRSTIADEDGADDLDRAKKNLHRALAIDDGNMAAMNQLALWHLDRGKRAGAKNGGTQAFELAALVCSQAIKKNARFAPLHNTAGLVEVELGNLSRASAAFDEARRLDPKLVEAHLNFAALNLSVRGFAKAEEAYRAALAVRPDDYDARVGLALAIRGQIDDASQAARVAEAQKELGNAKRLAPERPEAYFNEAILVQEYGVRGVEPAEAIAKLRQAKELYEQFLRRADGAPAFAETKKRAEERLADIRAMSEVIAAPPIK
jgi:Tfp pilus assembly protein PilF